MVNPLPIKQGLNPTRAQVPQHWPEPVSAADFVWHLVSHQRHRADHDDFAAVLARFAAGEVVGDGGAPLLPDTPLRPGTFISFYKYPAAERQVPGELTVLHRDDNIVVVDKPPFLATMPRGQHIRQTATVKARVQLDNPELSPCHRLDRLTRGVLMFTARQSVRGAYQTLFDRRVPSKVYEALTPLPDEAPFAPHPDFADWRSWHAPTPETPWVLRHRMIKIRGRLSTYLEPGEPNAETHITGMRVEHREGRDVCVWRMQPHTGKTHQLRVVLRALGLPIINDPLYAELSDAALVDPAAALPSPPHVEDEDFTAPMGLIAKELHFTDPLSGERRVFVSRF
ncbi:MAG TPA: pseudouridylate synthase [Candidatus Corynebacterium gallistercoris]|uniref:RNA pseudouridylate synthase n=1 Tax=Candidatus Corynebacterium gallistercoris TaxID=2838530 RepID=A0A9D1RZ57_9CORY|nr:pseudouridylate synthase [Candidatus Corynebacterium gallistercoris]